MIENKDVDFLIKCVDLAKTRQGFCAPNPPVGALIVDPQSRQILAEGVHWCFGADHAELAALKQLDGCANGAYLYVSLEPCSHYGKTPPCVDAIKRSGVARVIFAFLDPNPIVSGRGQAFLLDSGIEVIHHETDQANQLYRAYRHHIPCWFETPAFRPEGAHPLARSQRFLSAWIGQGCKPLPNQSSRVA